MPESQIVRRVTPAIKVSTMDSHKIVATAQPKPQHAKQPPRRTVNARVNPDFSGGQPLRPPGEDLKIIPQPIEVTMQAGGATVVRRPPATPPSRRVVEPSAPTHRVNDGKPSDNTGDGSK